MTAAPATTPPKSAELSASGKESYFKMKIEYNLNKGSLTLIYDNVVNNFVDFFAVQFRFFCDATDLSSNISEMTRWKKNFTAKI